MGNYNIIMTSFFRTRCILYSIL